MGGRVSYEQRANHVQDIKAAGGGAKKFVGREPFSEAWDLGFLPPSHRYSHSICNCFVSDNVTASLICRHRPKGR